VALRRLGEALLVGKLKDSNKGSHSEGLRGLGLAFESKSRSQGMSLVDRAKFSI
jgi:hypothetical protein